MPSRLEGMETKTRMAKAAIIAKVYMCLPVWREWKHICSIGILAAQTKSTCAFPFGGNGNISIGPLMMKSPTTVSTCAFPFGGNGNHPQTHSTHPDMDSLHVPSRLEGMETFYLP